MRARGRTGTEGEGDSGRQQQVAHGQLSTNQSPSSLYNYICRIFYFSFYFSSFFFTCVDPFSFSHNLSKITLTGDMSLLLFFSYSRIRVLYMHAAFDSLNCARYPAHGLRNQSIRKNLRCCSCAHSLSLSSSSLLLFWAVFRKRSALCLNVRI